MPLPAPVEQASGENGQQVTRVAADLGGPGRGELVAPDADAQHADARAG
jgi:hypothetical protein